MLNAAMAAETVPSLAIFFASQTGNGETVARRLGQSIRQAGYGAELRSLSGLKPAALKKATLAVFVISTHGDGDPPDDALDLFEFLEKARSPRLAGLRFRVLALGDSSYLQFCEAGRKLEALLSNNGAVPFSTRIECDLDYREKAAQFSGELVEFCSKELLPGDGHSGHQAVVNSAPSLEVVPDIQQWSRDRPFPATVESVSRLTATGSGKDVCHITLSLAGSGLDYEPGDSLGVRASNDPELVQELLDCSRLDPAELLELGGRKRTLREWLTQWFELTRLTPDTVRSWADCASGPGLSSFLRHCDDKRLQSFMERRQLADLAREFPARPDGNALLEMLRPLATRSYSIASSRAATGDDVELTVVTQGSKSVGKRRHGVASDFLNRRLQPGDEVGVFLEPNTRFRLPANRDTPLILVAAGTGIAPYRAFFQQLEEEGRSPRSWLFFGNPHLRTDFLYQSEWLAWRTSGLLDRIDTAFSRDQGEKRYVQHAVREQAAGICDWLDWGAHIYICGALAMGQEVERALLEGIAACRGLSEEKAGEQVAQLRRDRRLKKDLY